jgi:hypothetical protein
MSFLVLSNPLVQGSSRTKFKFLTRQLTLGGPDLLTCSCGFQGKRLCGLLIQVWLLADGAVNDRFSTSDGFFRERRGLRFRSRIQSLHHVNRKGPGSFESGSSSGHTSCKPKDAT